MREAPPPQACLAEVAPACLALEAQSHLVVPGAASCLEALVVRSCLGGQGVGPCLLVLLLPSCQALGEPRSHRGRPEQEARHLGALGNPMQQAIIQIKQVSKDARKPLLASLPADRKSRPCCHG